MTAERAGMTPEEWLDFNTDVDSWEYHATEHKVDQLLALMSAVCLREALPELTRIDRENRTLNQRLVSAYGAHGLRAALELNMQIELPRIYTDDISEEDMDDDQILMTFDTPLRLGPEYRDPVSLNVIKKIEQFGKALIDEAFDTLGDGALENVEKMQSDDVDQQMEAMEWLSQRIRDLGKTTEAVVPDLESDDAEPVVVADDEQDDTPDPYHYHPIRLSPKAIGTYPDQNLPPTCLAASIIASSFFERAGTQYLHAGVMMTGFQKRLEDSMRLFMDSRAMVNGDYGTSLSPIYADRMEIHAAKVYTDMIEDNGYHAAVCIKRADGKWLMVDPFARVLDSVADSKSEELDAIYDTLDALRDDAPAMELSFYSQRMSVEDGLRRAVKGRYLELHDEQQMFKAIQIMRSGADDMAERMYHEVMLPIFENARNLEDNPMVSGTMEMLFDFRDEYADQPERDMIRRAFDTAFNRYVLWGETAQAMTSRSAIDEEYFKNRLVDVFNLPIVMATTIASINLKDRFIGIVEHDKVELGLPHVRVGFSALSDFAAYTDSPLPPSFWFANWPSLIPITETMNREQNTIFQNDLVAITAEWTQQKSLTYIKAHSIISGFLSARNDSLKEE